MTGTIPSLNAMLQGLKCGAGLAAPEVTYLAKEMHGLTINKLIPSDAAMRIALFDAEGAEGQFARQPPFHEDLSRRGHELDEWYASVVRPDYLKESETSEREDQSFDDLDGVVKMAEEMSTSLGRKAMSEYSREQGPGSQILSPQEERELLLAYNYARHRVERIVSAEIDVSKLMVLEGGKLEELVRWVFSAIEVRDLLVRFHYRFVVKVAHCARGMIGEQFAIRDIINAGIDGMKAAINGFDLDRTERLKNFAWDHVFGAIIRRIKKDTNWSATTRPATADSSGQGAARKASREKIPDSDILRGQQDEGWSIFPSHDTQDNQHQSSTLFDDDRLRKEALKCEEFVEISRIRKAAAGAKHAKDPIHGFKTALNNSDLSIHIREHPSMETGFAPPEWRLVWKRRLLMVRCRRANG